MKDYPEKVMVEVSSICNYKCEGCPNLNLPRGNNNMDPELFYKIFDEIKFKTKKAMLWNFGEPLIHPEIENMLDYISSHPIFKVLSTNGALLSKFESYEFLKSLDVLVVSINGFTEETYAIHQKGGYLKNVEKSLPKLIQTLKNSKTVVNLQTVLHKGNLHEIDLVEKFAKKYAFDEYTIKSFNVMDSNEETHNKYVPNEAQYSRYSENQRIKSDFCKKGLVINWNGEVNPCCWDYKGENIIGNVNETSIYDVWKSNNKFREEIDNGKYLPICNNCFDSRTIKKEKLFDKVN